jgi:hypothetical protein
LIYIFKKRNCRKEEFFLKKGVIKVGLVELESLKKSFQLPVISPFVLFDICPEEKVSRWPPSSIEEREKEKKTCDIISTCTLSLKCH